MRLIAWEGRMVIEMALAVLLTAAMSVCKPELQLRVVQPGGLCIAQPISTGSAHSL